MPENDNAIFAAKFDTTKYGIVISPTLFKPFDLYWKNEMNLI